MKPKQKARFGNIQDTKTGEKHEVPYNRAARRVYKKATGKTFPAFQKPAKRP